MKDLTPDLYASICPNTSAAGFSLGLDYRTFIKSAKPLLINNFLDESIDDDTWRIYEQKVFNEITQKEYNFNYCYWNNSVVLVFNGNNFELESIQMYEGYKGKLFDEFQIGNKLSEVYKKFKLFFYADMHYLVDSDFECENDDEPNLIKGIALKTDYLVEFSDKCSEHIIEQINVFRV
ncbi:MULTISPECIES: hypothetical protein [Acinetobacter]|uniref:hypothetical protein n=1 Tax=Acinetobacter TaxID=469 RepID=UPI00125FB529|nr:MULTISPECIES: hypothetical protein [Acinetobacter]MBJ8552338.1 hypothetical protein [Acinetobacter bereziniae]MBJ9371971.1 hypothetical protein [Acinetobacter sp. TGL-Y2]